MKPFRTRTSVATLVLTFGLAAGIAPAATAAGTVKVGVSVALSGGAAAIGESNKNGIQLAIDKINANGGLLGKQVELVSADGELKPATGVTNVRNFVLNDHVKAVFGPVTSAAGAAESAVATQYRVPLFYTISNGISQTGKSFSKYAFQLTPNDYMEAHGLAAYVASREGKRNWKTYATIAPNYSFGHTFVQYVSAGLHKYGVNLKNVSQQWPALGTSNFTQYISSTQAKHPDLVFLGVFGGDLITLTKQAKGYGLFKNTTVFGFYMAAVLNAMGKHAPAGAITLDRAPPYYAHPTKAMQEFTNAYHKKFGSWPTAFSELGYAAVQSWAQGVKKAGSFDGDKVSAALSGATVNTVRGSFEFRACDHQAKVPEFFGVLSQDVSAKYGIRTMTHVYAAPPEKIMMSCKEKKKLQS